MRQLKKLNMPHGEICSPFFMPVATKAAVKNLTAQDLKDLGAGIVLANTYHLWLHPGADVIKKAGGLHKFMNWPGPILTDSGGFQIFSLSGRKEEASKAVRLTEKGVEFRDEVAGKKHFLTPEKSIRIQLDLGADVVMCLDECTPYPANYDYAKESLALTARWAKRCKDYFEKKTKNLPKSKKPLLFGICQGSVYKDLRRESAEQIVNIGFDGYAVGGVAVGEPRKYFWKALEWTLPLLPEKKFRYVMGFGRPEEIVRAVGLGVDMFDCVIPTREARHGRIYKFKSETRSVGWRVESEKQFKLPSSKFYETIQITNQKHRSNFKPIDRNCTCHTCQNYSRAYLRHLFATSEPLAQRLATTHNLKFYLDLMKYLKRP